MSRQIMTLFFFNIILTTTKGLQQRDLITLEKKIENKYIEYASDIVNWLENINYNNLNNSDIVNMLGYNEIKSKSDNNVTEARGMKMMSLALIPIIFHVGMTTSWIILTAFLAAKSVAIGLILLIFKIVVSSVKIASFITAWKIKKHHSELAWPVYHDHHGIHDHHHHPLDFNPHHSHTPDFGSHHHHTPDFSPHHSHTQDFGNYNHHTPDFNSPQSHIPDYGSHQPRTSDFTPQQTLKPDLTSQNSYTSDYGPQEFGPQQTRTQDFVPQQPHTQDLNSNQPQIPDLTSHPNLKSDLSSQLAPYKVHPPSLQENEYIESKKVDQKLG